MKIARVRIENFRSLKDVSIDFDSVTSFVGPNGVGKSSVLRALDWFFSPVGKSAVLDDDDVTNGCVGEKIRVEVQFDNLSTEDRTELGAYVQSNSDNFIAWKTRTPEGREYLSANAKSYSMFDSIRESGISAAEKKTRYKALRDDQHSLSLPVANSGPLIDAALRDYETANPSLLTDASDELQTNFFGFNSAGKMSGLFDYVLITADLRAAEESSDIKTSIIGRILERTIDRSVADEEISKIVEASRLSQQKIYNKHFKDPLAGVASRLNAVVSSYSPGRTVKVSPTEVELKAAKTTFGVSIQDGLIETSLDRQGHGFQRTVLISALQMLASEGAASEKGVIFLAIEEPELFQHPVQAQAFSKVLRELADDTGKNIQVAYATHSPHFVDGSHFHEVRRLVRQTSGDRMVSVHSCTHADIEARIGDVEQTAQIKRQLEGVISSKLPSAIFANAALLVEGTTEQAILEGIADQRVVGKFETSGIVVVPVGGKANIALPHAILTCLGIPTFSVFDADSGLESRSTANGKSPKAIATEVANNHKMNRRNLKHLGLIEEDMPAAHVGVDVAIFEDHLERLLNDEWATWQQKCIDHETATGEVIAKNSGIYRSIARGMSNSAPAQLNEIVDNVLALTAN